jgi:enterochelin esterase family protein
MKLPEMLDYLIGKGHIPPIAALMVDNADRSELICKPEFGNYIANEVIPWFRSSFPITANPAQTIIMGSSYGGLAAAYIAFTYPGIFGKVFSQTGWFRWRPENDPKHHWLARQLAAVPKVPVRFWLQVGNLEVAQMSDRGPTQLASNLHFRDTLQARGYFVSYQEYSGGHDSSSLEYPLAQTLIKILDQKTS